MLPLALPYFGSHIVKILNSFYIQVEFWHLQTSDVISFSLIRLKAEMAVDEIMELFEDSA